jgi:hypothetical protein
MGSWKACSKTGMEFVEVQELEAECCTSKAIISHKDLLVSINRWAEQPNKGAQPIPQRAGNNSAWFLPFNEVSGAQSRSQNFSKTIL